MPERPDDLPDRLAAGRAGGGRWSREELILAMNLYCKLPFGQLRHGNPDVKRLAAAMGRTPSSVSMKLCNLASFDPALAARGVKGLTGASRADKAVWDEFHHDWNALAEQSEALAQRLLRGGGVAEVAAEVSPALPAVDDFIAEAEAGDDPEAVHTGPTQTTRLVSVRLGQRFFRQAVLASYAGRCCLTGNPVTSLLIASHILPWSTHPHERTNPRNGLCLARTQDAAFDAGLITFDEDWRLVISPRLRDYLPSDTLASNFMAYEGKAIELPEKFRPEGAFMERHRGEVYGG